LAGSPDETRVSKPVVQLYSRARAAEAAAVKAYTLTKSSDDALGPAR
jgi:hypothetical protein